MYKETKGNKKKSKIKSIRDKMKKKNICNKFNLKGTFEINPNIDIDEIK